MTDISNIRTEYGKLSLSEEDVLEDPISQFKYWFRHVNEANCVEPNAVVLATCTPDAYPSARVVLLKGVDERGFVIFTDYRSRKGAELTDNPHAALCFHWPELERQVRVTGAVQRVSSSESNAYYLSRPIGSQIGAWASTQSSIIQSRHELEERVSELNSKFASEPISRPEYWGGFRILPEEVEFWQGRKSRLHDRILYTKSGGNWKIVRLSP